MIRATCSGCSAARKPPPGLPDTFAASRPVDLGKAQPLGAGGPATELSSSCDWSPAADNANRRGLNYRPALGAFISRSGSGDCGDQSLRIVGRSLISWGRMWALGVLIIYPNPGSFTSPCQRAFEMQGCGVAELSSSGANPTSPSFCAVLRTPECESRSLQPSGQSCQGIGRHASFGMPNLGDHGEESRVNT